MIPFNGKYHNRANPGGDSSPGCHPIEGSVTNPFRGGRCSGGRSWWARQQFSRIDTELTILPEKVEDNRRLGAFRHEWSMTNEG